ncbi:MAG: hypothetical protein JWQ12_661 [Glaciihabitans sp.]|nr:hypothetical protein [Glaciihabitans sp.]
MNQAADSVSRYVPSKELEDLIRNFVGNREPLGRCGFTANAIYGATHIGGDGGLTRAQSRNQTASGSVEFDCFVPHGGTRENCDGVYEANRTIEPLNFHLSSAVVFSFLTLRTRLQKVGKCTDKRANYRRPRAYDCNPERVHEGTVAERQCR